MNVIIKPVSFVDPNYLKMYSNIWTNICKTAMSFQSPDFQKQWPEVQVNIERCNELQQKFLQKEEESLTCFENRVFESAKNVTELMIKLGKVRTKALKIKDLDFNEIKNHILKVEDENYYREVSMILFQFANHFIRNNYFKCARIFLIHLSNIYNFEKVKRKADYDKIFFGNVTIEDSFYTLKKGIRFLVCEYAEHLLYRITERLEFNYMEEEMALDTKFSRILEKELIDNAEDFLWNLPTTLKTVSEVAKFMQTLLKVCKEDLNEYSDYARIRIKKLPQLTIKHVIVDFQQLVEKQYLHLTILGWIYTARFQPNLVQKLLLTKNAFNDCNKFQEYLKSKNLLTQAELLKIEANRSLCYLLSWPTYYKIHKEYNTETTQRTLTFQSNELIKRGIHFMPQFEKLEGVIDVRYNFRYLYNMAKVCKIVFNNIQESCKHVSMLGCMLIKYPTLGTQFCRKLRISFTEDPKELGKRIFDTLTAAIDNPKI